MKSFSTQVPFPCAMGSSVYKSISWNRFPDFNFLGLLIRRLLVKILLTRKLGIRAKRVKMDTAPSQTQSFGQTEINWDKYVFLFPNLLIYMRFYVFLCSLWGNLLVVFPMFLRDSLHFNPSLLAIFLQSFIFPLWIGFVSLSCYAVFRCLSSRGFDFNAYMTEHESKFYLLLHPRGFFFFAG